MDDGGLPEPRALRDVRLVPDGSGHAPEPGPALELEARTRTPLTAEEEARCRAVFAEEIGGRLARQGRASWPAHTPEERIRLYDVARVLTERFGREVRAEPEDILTVGFTLGAPQVR